MEEVRDSLVEFRLGLVGFIKYLAALITSVTIIGYGVVWLSTPAIQDLFEAREKPILIQLELLNAKLTTLSAQFNTLPQPPIVEFNGRGSVARSGPFRRGGSVPIVYSLRRNATCPTSVEIHFIEQRGGTIATEYTSRVTGTQASVIPFFQNFTINVRLPRDMRPGIYAYEPILMPDPSCSDGHPIAPPRSDWFEVIE
jgi:hypothetical protein